jgi:4'-phosphopantetheinyl transferase
MTSSPLQLSPGRVDLWCVEPEAVDDPALLQAYAALLDERERERHGRYLFPHSRHAFLVSHALVRTVLSRYADVPPADWRFDLNEHGRPELVLPPGCPPVRFNLSHTGGLAVVGVTLERDLGVDVEDRQRRGRPLLIADHYFAPPEVSALRQLPTTAEQLNRFFDHWTLKEAYMKARGIGVSLGLSNFWFDLERGRPLRISFSPAIEDDPDAWQLLLLEPSPRHRAAIALRSPTLELTVRRTLPLHSEEDVTGQVEVHRVAR